MFVNPSKATAIGNTLFASAFPSAVVILLSLQHNKVHISRSNHLWVCGDKPESEFDSSQSETLRRALTPPPCANINQSPENEAHLSCKKKNPPPTCGEREHILSRKEPHSLLLCFTAMLSESTQLNICSGSKN